MGPSAPSSGFRARAGSFRPCGDGSCSSRRSGTGRRCGVWTVSTGCGSSGVSRSRSPYRPNPLGLSCVELEGIDGMDLLVKGADLMDGTPIYDIKPYVAYADSFPEARCGFASTAPEAKLEVRIPEELTISQEEREELEALLALDPRPAYQEDPERVYGMPFGGKEVHFRVDNGILTVIDYA